MASAPHRQRAARGAGRRRHRAWLDQIRRGLITSGELARMRDEYSLRGVTSNPAIFEKAILGSTDYDDELPSGWPARALTRRRCLRADGGRRPPARGRRAAAGLRRDHGATATSRWRSRPTSRTTPRARSSRPRDYWAPVDRPNVMIKIPATRRGHAGDRAGDLRGHQRQHHAAVRASSTTPRVAEAYIRGLERRLAEGKPLDVALGRLLLRLARRHRGRQAARGARPRRPRRHAPALANARAAYRRFEEIFAGERFAALRAAGAPVQRPLWASTGTKNPPTPRRMYVDGLVGARHGQHDAAEDAAGRRPSAARSSPAAPRIDPTRGARRAGRRRDRHRRRHRRRCSRRHRGVRGRRWTSCSPASTPRARRSLTGRPPRSQRRSPTEPRARSPRASRRAVERGRRAPRLGQGRVAVGRPGRARDRRPARLADDLRHDARARRRARRLRARGASPTATRDAVLLGMGGSSLAPGGPLAHVRRARRRARPARARLDRPGRDPRRRGGDRPRARRCSSSRRSRAARSRRCRCSSTSTRSCPTAATSSRSPTRAARCSSWRATHGFRARLRERPEHRRALLGAVALRARARRR